MDSALAGQPRAIARRADRAAILGDASSIFPVQLGLYWQSLGMAPTIVTHNRAFRDVPEVRGVPVRCSRGGSPLAWARQVAGRRRAVPAPATQAAPAQGLPPFALSIAAGLGVARVARVLRPRFVFGQEVYYYGPATALCFGYPKVLFPWGYDIRDYADSSRGAFAMVRWALRSADLVVPSSSAAADYICTRFGTTREKVQAVSWGIDQRQFQRADMARRQAILERYGIPPAARVVSNVRRCHPDWGCDLAFEAFCTLAAENPALHFVLLGGAGDLTNQIMGRMRATLAKWGLERRFTLFDRDMPLEEFADVVAVTDVFTSLPQFTDMRSWSVLQAAASGAAPVLTDQEEYRRMTDQGFRALFVPPGRADVVADAVRTLLADETGTSAMTHDNVRYIEQHESWDVHMQRMLQLIDAVCERQKERLL